LVARGRKVERLQDRDDAILTHVNQYRMTTREVLHSQFFDDDSELNAVTKVTSRLCKSDHLVRHDLIGTSSYFVLGKKGGRRFGSSRIVGKPLNVQSLYMNWANLLYCAADFDRRSRLSVSELRQHYPTLLVKGIHAENYNIEAFGDKKRIVFLSIDASGNVQHVIRKTKEAILKRSRSPYFAAFMEQKRFAVCCVTFTEQIEHKLLDSFARESMPCDVFVEHYRELEQLEIRPHA